MLPGTGFAGSTELAQHIGNLVQAAGKALQGDLGKGGEEVGRVETAMTSQCLGRAH